MSRVERVEAAADAVRAIDGPASIGSAEVVDAALAASDALLRTDAAVERVAEAIAQAEDERHWLWLGSGIKDSYRRMARAVIAALLDGEA